MTEFLEPPGGDSRYMRALDLLDGFHRLRRNGMLCDVTLVAGGNRIRCHRALLAASSPLFAALFYCTIEHNEEFRVDNITPGILGVVVDFLYTGALEVTLGGFENVLEAGKMLAISTLVKCCDLKLSELVTVETCVPSLRAARDHELPQLETTSLRLLAENFEDFSLTKGFYTLKIDDVIQLIGKDELNIANEILALEAILRWLKFEADNRREFTATLLALIRFAYIKPCRTLRLLQRECVSLNPEVRDELEGYSFAWERGPELGSNTRPRDGFPFHKVSLNLNLVAQVDKYRADGRPPRAPRSTTLSERCSSTPNLLEPPVPPPRNRRRPVCRNISNASSCSSIICKYRPIRNHRNGRDSSLSDEADFSDTESQSEVRVSLRVPIMEPTSLQPIGELETSGFVPPPTLTNSSSVVVSGWFLYVAGGVTGGESVRSVWMLDTKRLVWSKRSPMISSRMDHWIAVMGQHIFAFGGRNSSGILRSAEKYNPSEDVWTPIRNLPIPLAEASGTVYRGQIYLVGGVTTGGAVSQMFYKYSSALDRWFPLDSMPTPRAGPGVTYYDHKLFVLGGRVVYTDEELDQSATSWLTTADQSATSWLTTAEFYDLELEEWVVGPDLPVPLADIHVGYHDNELVVVGAVQDDSVPTPTVVTPSNEEPSPVAVYHWCCDLRDWHPVSDLLMTTPLLLATALVPKVSSEDT